MRIGANRLLAGIAGAMASFEVACGSSGGSAAGGEGRDGASSAPPDATSLAAEAGGDGAAVEAGGGAAGDAGDAGVWTGTATCSGQSQPIAMTIAPSQIVETSTTPTLSAVTVGPVIVDAGAWSCIDQTFVTMAVAQGNVERFGLAPDGGAPPMVQCADPSSAAFAPAVLFVYDGELNLSQPPVLQFAVSIQSGTLLADGGVAPADSGAQLPAGQVGCAFNLAMP